MNVGIRRVGLAVTALLLLLVGQLTYLQVVDAKTLSHHEGNGRDRLKDLRSPRGTIVSADNQILAISKPSGDEYHLQRDYPLGALTSAVVGYQSIVVGSTGLESTYSAVLSGRDQTGHSLRDRTIDFFRGTTTVGNLTTSLRVDAQLVAKNALADQKGSVVVLDPTTGEIIVMYSNPSFDPQPLAGHTAAKVQAAFDFLNNDPAKPSLARAYREIYPPGSTFKVVTTTAALDAFPDTVNRVFPSRSSLPIPLSDRPIGNFGGRTCGGDLETVFTNSCNTAFAQLGLDLGNLFPPAMQKFGIYERPPLDIAPGAVASAGPTADSFDQNKPRFALAGIGQGDVFTTPLQMALVAGGIANGGVIMRPHAGKEILDDEGKLLTRIKPTEWQRATTPETAAQLTDLMTKVVDRGTGTAARIPGISVAGKTGTAQTVEGAAPHAWFVAFAPAEAPRYAIAVLVENGGSQGGDATGGHLAAPIAKQVLQFLLGA
ncbi:MAG: penicillin-binding protein 2 [Acidimicrobiia bacterium]|nr:penicillin-binding protein 2 [Acidimicrobiia bacterium]